MEDTDIKTQEDLIVEDDFNDEYRENPSETANLKDRITDLEATNKEIKQSLEDMTLKVVSTLDELKQRPTVIDPDGPHVPQLETIGQLAKIQQQMMAPMNDMAHNFFNMGMKYGSMEKEIEHESERAEEAIDTLQNVKVQLEAAANKPPQDYGKIIEALTPALEKVIGALSSIKG